jgi:hypothetical protein
VQPKEIIMSIASIAIGIGESILEELVTDALGNTSFQAAFIGWIEGLGAKLKINPTSADDIGNALIAGAESILGAIVAGTPAAANVDPAILPQSGHGDAPINA